MITYTQKPAPIPDGKHTAVRDRGPVCVHCLRRCGSAEGGMARIRGLAVCSKPIDETRPDCYRMVMVKFHPLRDCAECVAVAAK